MTFSEGLIGYEGNITEPDVKELLNLLRDYILCVRHRIKISDLIYPRSRAFQVTSFFFFKVNFCPLGWTKFSFSFEGMTLAGKEEKNSFDSGLFFSSWEKYPFEGKITM